MLIRKKKSIKWDTVEDNFNYGKLIIFKTIMRVIKALIYNAREILVYINLEGWEVEAEVD